MVAEATCFLPALLMNVDAEIKYKDFCVDEFNVVDEVVTDLKSLQENATQMSLQRRVAEEPQEKHVAVEALCFQDITTQVSFQELQRTVN